MTANPRISVLMAVYNGGEYLRLAVESLLCQTFADFELIIVDDGSTDETAKVIASLSEQDNRIQPIRNPTNSGLIASLNRGLSLCRSDIVARADADDLFHPNRLREQYEYLQRHADVGVLGSAVSFIDASGNPSRQQLHDFPLDADQVRVNSMLGCCLWHTTVMFRKALVDDAGGYKAHMAGGPEDYDLWATLLPRTKIVNLPSVLAFQRLHGSSITANWNVGFSLYCEVARRLLQDYLNHPVSLLDATSTVALCGCDGDTKSIDVPAGISLFQKIDRLVRKRESRTTANQFRDKCVHGLLRHAAANVYKQPQLTRRLLKVCAITSPAVLFQSKVYGIAARSLTPAFIRNALKVKR